MQVWYNPNFKIPQVRKWCDVWSEKVKKSIQLNAIPKIR